MAKLRKHDESPDHAASRALLPDFWRKVEQQEADLINRGLPAAGMVDVLRIWFDGWATQDVEKIKQCVTEDATYIDSSSFQVRLGRPGLTTEHCRLCFDACPDIAFYPQDGTNRSLPYFDYFEGQWRITIPWRGIGRFTGKVELPQYPGVVIPPNGRCLNFIGIDRYTMTDDFKITHIDTDWDILYAALQMAPFGVSAADRALRLASRPIVFRVIAALAQVSMPLIRFLNKFSATPARLRDTTVQEFFAPDRVALPYGAQLVIDEAPSIDTNASGPKERQRRPSSQDHSVAQ